ASCREVWPARAVQRDRGLALQRDALRGHRQPQGGQDRPRQDGPDVPPAAQPRRAGRGPGRLQAEQAQPDLDRVVPGRTPKPEYLFFVDFEGHRDDPKVSKTLKTLEGLCLELTVLGSFPAATLASS